jgi:hypothetical protein
LSKQFSPGQKALCFYWFLDAEVTNGGFVQFYYNGKDRYLPPILEGLKLIGDVELINLVLEVEAEYQVNKEEFESYRRRNDFSGLAKTFNWYEKYDQKYYQLHDRTMKLLEQYARKHATEFGEIK